MVASKRLRTPNNSPDKPTDKSAKLDTCVKCNEIVSDDCIACYWCAQWEHRACANIKEKELVILGSNTENILFFCSQCLPNLPNALSLFKFHSQLNEKLDSKFKSLEDKLHEGIADHITSGLNSTILAQFNAVCQKLEKSIEEVSTKINKLSLLNNNLQMEIDTTSESLSTSAQPRPVLAPAASYKAALSIADELADRERRKKNIIVYNFPEASDRQLDKDSFIDLCKSVHNFNISITKIIRLGKKVADKHRPMLLSLEHDEDKSLLLSCSHLIRRNDLYKNVFLAPDRTRFEREKHKKLVEELKERRSQGETNLTIRNGAIITRLPRPGPNPTQSS